jgi:hypothetical protein
MVLDHTIDLVRCGGVPAGSRRGGCAAFPRGRPQANPGERRSRRCDGCDVRWAVFRSELMFQYSSIRNGNGDSLHEVCARRRAGLTHPRGTCTISLIRICTGAIVCKMPK